MSEATCLVCGGGCTYCRPENGRFRHFLKEMLLKGLYPRHKIVCLPQMSLSVHIENKRPRSNEHVDVSYSTHKIIVLEQNIFSLDI